MTIRRLLAGGLLAMAMTALGTAIWPGVAAVVGLVFGLVLTVAVAVPVAFAVRWVRGELAWRRELRAMPPVGAAAPYGAAPMVPSLAELRETA